MSLKSRIRDAQREAAKHATANLRRHTTDKEPPAMISSQDPVEDEMKRATPTVDEIRTALLRKSANGKKTR